MDPVYRALQEHLDRQPVGFPAARDGADLRLLGHFFTPEEARLALHLSHRPTALDDVVASAADEFTAERVALLLESMFQSGAIGLNGRGGAASVNRRRCIGCGLCVSSCLDEAVRLVKKEASQVPPRNEEELQSEILSHKRGGLARWCALIVSALKPG